MRAFLHAGLACLFASALTGCEPTTTPATPAAARPGSARQVFLFLGDSLTAGYGIAMEDAFPALLDERWRKEGLPFSARNAGVSGSTTAGVLENLEWTLAGDVRRVLLCIGANDGLRGLKLAASRKNIASIIEKAQARGVTVVLAGMRIPPNYGEAYAREFSELFPALARRHGVKLLPFLLDGVAGIPEMNIADGIHPNESGHRRIADGVHAFLLKEGLLR